MVGMGHDHDHRHAPSAHADRRLLSVALVLINLELGLWTLLVARHERLWAVGAYVYGHAVDAHVPPLHAAAVEKGSKARGRAASRAGSDAEADA